jgi:hypothetical protein
MKERRNMMNVKIKAGLLLFLFLVGLPIFMLKLVDWLEANQKTRVFIASLYALVFVGILSWVVSPGEEGKKERYTGYVFGLILALLILWTQSR